MVLQVGMMGATTLGWGLLMAIVGIVLGAVFLWVSAKLFKLRDQSFMTPLTISAIAGAVGFVLGMIPFVNMVSWVLVIILALWLIKTRYNIAWGKAILVWLVYFVLSLVAMGIIGIVFMGGMMAMMGG